VILAAPSIPYTLTGKRMEVPVRKLLMGWPAERAFNRGSMQNGTAMDWYLDFADKRREVVTPRAVR
jgi:acetoacetyl-CoA synthetase